MSGSIIPREITKERESRVWALRQQGYTHQRIADELGVERSTVTKMLKRLSERSSKQLMGKMIEEKERQWGLLDNIVCEAMLSWTQSKDPTKSVTKTQPGETGVEGKSTVTQKVEDQDGDPRYLETAMHALTDIRKLLGLDQPMKVLGLNPKTLSLDQITAILDGNADILSVMSEDKK